ncbi:hypothetical protein AWC38_SpisGene5247, partial [Stylophora pistillata]
MEMRADELMRKMWDEELLGITNQNKPFTAEEVLATRKVAESRCYAEGRYEEAIPWQDDEPPLYCNKSTAEDRLYSLEKHLQRRLDVAEKYCQVMEANEAKGYIRKLEPGEIDDDPSCNQSGASRIGMFIEHHRFPESVQPNSSHHGKTGRVTSDNGTNFVGAERELRELVQSMDQEQIAGNVSNDGIKWSWNPPLGSHFGGVFESLVKVAKKTLKAIVGNAGLTD